jgi:hypothetical protein
MTSLGGKFNWSRSQHEPKMRAHGPRGKLGFEVGSFIVFHFFLSHIFDEIIQE